MPIDYKKLYQSHDIILTNANPESLVEDGTLESVGYLKDYFKERERHRPPVDFSDLKNFARFGSAKKYYVDAFDRIYETYPYDGSLKERIQWELSSSFFDLYVFEEVYPRTNGYVILSADGWGTQIADSDGYGAPATASYEYIFAKGGPNTSNRSKDKDIVDSSGDYKSGYANVWEPSKNRECNLKIGGIDGNTVEFWMKKSEFVTSKTGREVIFDASTSDFISSSANYGRLTIEMTGTTAVSPFRVTYMSGTAGFSDEIVGSSITTSSIADDSWHHYAFALKNSGSNVEINFYFDGACNQTIVTGSSIGYVSGNINATIGSLITAPSGTFAPTLGWGKLSGSLDEFRFWKDERSSAEVIRYMIEPVGGGTNTDDANTALGVYYKFNEGIVGDTTYDSVVLDYSGRISNGTFVGYDSASRNVGSAMVSSSLVTKEFKDPILYPFHPDVQSTLDTKKEEGEIHDFANNSSMYHSLPAWIIEEDEDKEYSPLKNLTQIVGSYFDSLAEQINSIPKLKYKSHVGFNHKPAPFNDRLLQSIGFEYFPELFSDATELEYFKSRNDRSLFEEKLYNIKNRIYHNIYDNIVYINKTKGTEKSFRNLIHCFGVGDEIYRINTYGNRVTYTLKDNYKSVAEYKKYVNFGLTGSSEATVFPHSSSTNSNSKAIISGTYGLTDYIGFTMESEVHFPIRHSMADTNTVATTDEGPSRQFRTYMPFTTASLFGMHQVKDDATGNDLTWATTDSANFQVYAVKASDYSQRSKFLLTGTAGSVIGALGLSSSYFDEVFDDTRWTFSVSVKPNSNANLPDGSSGSVDNAGYAVEFYGVEKIADYVKNEFLHTGTISADGGSSFLNYPKAPYIGAHRTNFSGTLLQKADGNISSTRVWYKYLPTGTIQQHNQDVKNYGAEHPYRSSYLYPTALTGTRIPEIDTLVLNWTFDTVTGSDGSGEFIGADYSSGSAQKVSKYGQFGEIVGKQYLPKGFNFPANSTLPINKKYVSSAKKQLPEMINSADMVNILTDDDIFFNKGEIARPTNYYTSIEKSMYQTISDEMIKMFSTIKDFNNLVGEPVNKYRDDYKDMAKLRQMFYERVGNTPSLDKYVDFYKWIDLTLDVLLGYLVPMSSDISDQYGSNVRTMVENTVLQRNKYRWKYPTLEDKTPTIEGNILGINELLYNWEFGHAPLNTAGMMTFVAASSQYFSVPDAAAFSFGDGATDSPFSANFWLKTSDMTTLNLFSKYGALSNQEYWLFTDGSDRFDLYLTDESSGATAHARSTAITAYEDQLINVTVTYDGGGGATAADGISIYINGIALAMTAFNSVTYTAMENLNHAFEIGRGFDINYTDGTIGNFSLFDKELSAAEALLLYNNGCDSNVFSLLPGNLVAYYKLNDLEGTDSSGNGYTGSPQNNPTISSFICKNPQANNCLWWKDRTSRSTPPLSSSNAFVNSNKQTILDSIINETNASAPTLGSSGSSGITTYAGSTYVTRRLAKPYRLKVDESPLIKGGVNEFVNKQTDLLTFIKYNTSGSYLQIPSASVKAFKSCNDDLALNDGKRKQNYNSSVTNFKLTEVDKSYLNSKGDLYTPFDIYSASLSGGYHDAVANNFKAGIDITNLHEDTYGPLYGRPIQSPFTEKFVGGKVYRHIYSNLRPQNTSPDTAANRIEGWRIMFSASSLYAFGSGFNNSMTVDPSLEKGSMLRGESTKRPVNIRNIKMFTGSSSTIPGRPDQVLDATNIGNYSHNYELVMTNGRSINNRYLAESDGNLPTTYAPSTYVTGVIDFAIPRRDLTGSTKSIIVNRFSAPGSPATMGEGMLDLAAAEYSVYNALPWRNLNVRTPLNEWYTDHTNQFGYFSDAQTVAAYALAGVPYIGGSSSVEASNYDGTGSFHKVNRNSKKKLGAIEYHNNKVLYFNGATAPSAYSVNIGAPAIWDALIGTAVGSTQTFTLSAWVNPMNLGHAGGNNDPHIFDFADCVRLSVDSTGKVYFRARFNTTVGEWSTVATIDTNEWAHIAVTYDATSVANDPTIYVNGLSLAVTEDTTPAGTYVGITGADCFLGDRSGLGRAWQGFLDELSVFHRECSASEILEIYYGTTNFDPDLERQGPGDLSKHSRVSRLIAWWGGEGWTSGLTLPAQYGSLDGTLVSSNMVIDNNGALVKKLEGAVYIGPVSTYDNWFVQHQMLQTSLQYTWITASVIYGYTGSAYYGFEQPNFSNASLASTDITFLSASEWSPSLHGGLTGAPMDFAGINSIIYDPVIPYENTLSASSNTGIDKVFAGAGLSTPIAFNGLVLHRQGPYGWPSWKQIRGAQNPVMRYNYKNNIQTFTKVTSSIVDGDYIGYNNGIVSQVEPPITSKFNPLKYQYTYKSDQPFSVPPNNQPTNMWASYGNEKAYFTNIPDPKISNLLDLNNSNLVWSRAGQIGETLQAADNTILAYDTLKKYLLWNTPTYISGDANPIDEFRHMQISEGIYPREHYTYLSLVRERPNFINNFWKDLRADRNLKTINSQGYITASHTAFWRTASIWSLDADDLGELRTMGNELYSSGSEGELQNSYSIWHGPVDSGLISPIAGATYNRRIPQVYTDSPFVAFYLGQTEWEAGEQSGYNPSYNTYKEYAEDVRSIGKDYGIVPEYRISEHMEYHVVDMASSGGFLADNPGWLTLTGSVISSSADTTLLGSGSFYTVYSNADFLKYFQPIDSDFSSVAMPTNLTLKCNALMKFLPYDGFYPSERSVQLATLFSQSYAPNADLTGSEANWRTLMTPFFAPGILYNSIKSGLAVDYPLFTGSLTDYITANAIDHYVGIATTPPTKRAPFEALVNPDYWLSDIGKIVDAETHRSSSIDSTGSFGKPANDLYNMAINNFTSEVPRFFLGATDGKNDNDYGPMTTFVSKETLEGSAPLFEDPLGAKAEGNFIYFTADKTYKMRIVCSHSEIRDLATLQDTSTVAGALRYNNSASYEYNPPTIMMYNRAFDRTYQTKYLSLTASDSGYNRGVVPWFSGTHTVGVQVNTTHIPVYGSSFGPPIYAGSHTAYAPGIGWAGKATGSFEPYTPPYYNGYSHIEISYTPEFSGYKTITDVMSAITASYYRDMITSGAAVAISWPPDVLNTVPPAAQAAMQLSASINWNQVVTEGSKTRWVIQPKWECPILDFTNITASIETVNREWSIAKGMWHQYGTIPSADSGVFLEIQPVSGSQDNDTVGNLAEKLGFNLNPSKKLGQIPIEGKTISEAIVAVPFYEDSQGSRNFFHIDRKTIDWAQSKLLNPEIKDIDYLIKNLSSVDGAVKYKPAPSVVNLVKAMKKYVIPPGFNFLMNKNQEPMAMVIFEFDHHFTQDDLVKMWQGVLPSEKRTDSASGIQCAVSEIDFGMNLLAGEVWKPDPTNTGPAPAPPKAEDVLDANKGFDLLNDVPGDKIGPAGIGFPKNIQWMVFKVKQKASWSYHDITATNMMPGPPPPGAGPAPVPGLKPLDYSYNWPYDFFSLIELAKINETVTLTPRTEPISTPTIIDMLKILPLEVLWTIPPVSDSVTETDPDTFIKNALGSLPLISSPQQFIILQAQAQENFASITADDLKLK